MHTGIEQFLLRIQHIQNRSVADGVFRTHALQPKLRGSDCSPRRFDNGICSKIAGIGRTHLGDDITFDGHDLFERGSGPRGCLALQRRRTTALKDRYVKRYASLCSGRGLWCRDGRTGGIIRVRECPTQGAQKILIIIACEQGNGREAARFRYFDFISCGRRSFLGSDQIGIVFQCDEHRIGHVLGQTGERRRRRQIGRRFAHELDIAFPRTDQIGLRGLQIGPRQCQTGLRLRDVGPGQIADFEPIFGRLQISRQHIDLIGGKTHQRFIADYVHVSGNHLAENS